MSIIQFENESTIDMYVGDTVFRNVRLVSEETNYDEDIYDNVVTRTSMFTAHGTLQGSFNLDAAGMWQAYLEREERERVEKVKKEIKLKELQFKGLMLQKILDKDFKAVNLTPRTNKAARRFLVAEPEMMDKTGGVK